MPGLRRADCAVALALAQGRPSEAFAAAARAARAALRPMVALPVGTRAGAPSPPPLVLIGRAASFTPY